MSITITSHFLNGRIFSWVQYRTILLLSLPSGLNCDLLRVKMNVGTFTAEPTARTAQVALTNCELSRQPSAVASSHRLLPLIGALYSEL